MHRRPVACWLWRRFMTVAAEPMPPGSAVSACRRCVTGFYGLAGVDRSCCRFTAFKGSPELNPVEAIWQFLHDNWLSNRIFESYDDIIALCCDA